MRFQKKTTRGICAVGSQPRQLSLFVLLVAAFLISVIQPAYSQEEEPQRLNPNQTNPDLVGEDIPDGVANQPARDSTQTAPTLPLWYALFVAVIGGLIAWFRLLVRFQPYWGLGVTRNVYSICLISVVGVLSGVCYLVLASKTITGGGLLPEHWDWLPRFDSVAAAQTMTIVGGSALGQIVTIVGRFMRGGNIQTLSSAQVDELKKIRTSNFIYVLIRESIATRMSHELVVMTKNFDQETIKTVTIRLIADQVTIGKITSKDGDDKIAKISAYETSSNQREAEQSSYEILHEALRAGGFRQLQMRFDEISGTPA